MTPDIKIEVPLPGEKLLLAYGRPSLKEPSALCCVPWQMRREGRALADGRREDALILAQTERDVEDIRSSRKSFDGELSTRRTSRTCQPVGDCA